MRCMFSWYKVGLLQHLLLLPAKHVLHGLADQPVVLAGGVGPRHNLVLHLGLFVRLCERSDSARSAQASGQVSHTARQDTVIQHRAGVQVVQDCLILAAGDTNHDGASQHASVLGHSLVSLHPCLEPDMHPVRIGRHHMLQYSTTHGQLGQDEAHGGGREPPHSHPGVHRRVMRRSFNFLRRGDRG